MGFLPGKAENGCRERRVRFAQKPQDHRVTVASDSIRLVQGPTLPGDWACPKAIWRDGASRGPAASTLKTLTTKWSQPCSN